MSVEFEEHVASLIGYERFRGIGYVTALLRQYKTFDDLKIEMPGLIGEWGFPDALFCTIPLHRHVPQDMAWFRMICERHYEGRHVLAMPVLIRLAL